MFSCEYCENVKNSFYRIPPVAASERKPVNFSKYFREEKFLKDLHEILGKCFFLQRFQSAEISHKLNFSVILY